MIKKLENSDIEWRGNVPVAPTFGDVYYSVDDGLAETNYVFLGGVGAPECWMDTDHFVIAETGFGTGLNFLATYKAWKASEAKGRLTFISVEAFPLSEAALEQAHRPFPEVAEFASKLRKAWPAPAPGYHHRYFEDGQIQLILMFGEASTCYGELHAEVDAWFLDGFAPAKNPDMWSDALFDQIARLSKPNARFATFTSAGFVKRGLAARGFEVEKTRGYGRKRDRLIGTMQNGHTAKLPRTTKEWAIPNKALEGDTLIVGAGIAGRTLAAALKRRGHHVTIIGSDRPTGSLVPSAILAPGFQAGAQPTSAYATSAFCHACWFPGYVQAWSESKGVDLRAYDAETKARLEAVYAALSWSGDWAIMQENALHFPRSGSVDSRLALETIYPSNLIQPGLITSIEQTSAGWLVTGQDFREETSNLVIASGYGARHLIPGAEHMGWTGTCGQIETIAAGAENVPATSQSGTGYVTAPMEGKQTLGSTFSQYKGDGLKTPETTREATNQILAKIEAEFGLNFAAGEPMQSWAGIRASSRDYLPHIGPVPNWDKTIKRFEPLSKNKNSTGLGTTDYLPGLHVFAGFGSKGFQQAPYAAEILAAQITDDPIPIAQSVNAYLHPARHLIRSIIRNQLRV